jgi:hypothetical protein
VSALETLRECLELSRQAGLRRIEMFAHFGIATVEIAIGDYHPALDLLRASIQWEFDAGDFYALKWPLALTTALLARCDLAEPAATIAGYATTPFTLAAYPQFATAVDQLRETLGDSAFDRLGQRGRTLPSHEIVAYALEAIEEARVQLDQLDSSGQTPG